MKELERFELNRPLSKMLLITVIHSNLRHVIAHITGKGKEIRYSGYKHLNSTASFPLWGSKKTKGTHKGGAPTGPQQVSKCSIAKEILLKSAALPIRVALTF